MLGGSALGSIVAAFTVFLALVILAWRRYRSVSEKGKPNVDSCLFSLKDDFGGRHPDSVPHQNGAQWLTDIFHRSAIRYPTQVALRIPHSGESLTYEELSTRAEAVAAAVSTLLTGPDQVVVVAMPQDSSEIVAAHLGILRAGGTVMFLDTTLPESLITHMLDDARPAVVLTRGQDCFRELPTIDVLALPEGTTPIAQPSWLDDPRERLATIFYTSGTTGMPKGVECPHAGYVNLALTYADYFDLTPGQDATSLTSSLGYDGSLSEMYTAWVSGCTVVLLTKEEVRSGRELLPILAKARVTVLFCPPVLLTTLTATPEKALPYPLCRYIVPAGEAFPPALVEPWTRGRRQIINTYGPTEASTDTSRQSLRPGEPVTIGSPLANVTYVILEVGGLTPLPHGEIGELCIGGVHVARGYRNQPDQTAEKFITHDSFGRLYRTGDRCYIDGRSQRVHFLGRIDTQLKVRGHRVEIQPVEDMLLSQFPTIEAAVLDYQNEELVAFVVAPTVTSEEVEGFVSAPRDWAAEVTNKLADQLPEPSVPSRIFLVDHFTMKPVSQKIDRACLPDLSKWQAEDTSSFRESSAHRVSTPTVHGASNPDEESVLELCREMIHPSLGWDDNFVEHGAHSIAIARLANRLNEVGRSVSVSDLLTDTDTARKAARRPLKKLELEPTRMTVVSAPEDQEVAPNQVLSVGYFTILQALFLMLFYAPSFLALVALLSEADSLFVGLELPYFVLLGLLIYLLGLGLPFAHLFWGMILRFCFTGKTTGSGLKPGVYGKWSRMHLRAWCVGRLQSSVFNPLNTVLRSPPVTAWILRRLGATVGQNVHCAHGVAFLGPLDLLTIEDHVTVQTGAYLCMSRWIGQELHIGPVYLEAGCKIGMRAGVSNGVRVGRGSWITPLTAIMSDVGPEEMWEGAPARFAGCYDPLRDTPSYRLSPGLLGGLGVLVQVLLDSLLLVLPTAAIVWFAATVFPVDKSVSYSEYLQTTSLSGLVRDLTLLAFCVTWTTRVLLSLLGCLFLRFTATGPGRYPSRGLRATLILYRVKLMDRLQRVWTWSITGQYLRALAGVRFSRVGRSECDVMLNLVPELVRADSDVFFAHGCLTNVLDEESDYLTLRRMDVPAKSFFSNNAVAEHGQFPSNFLLGVSTPANETRLRRQLRTRLGRPITVAGNPPVEFGSSENDDQSSEQDEPTFPLFLARVFLHDVLSIGTLPIAEGLFIGLFYTLLYRLTGHAVLCAGLALVLAEVVLVLSCIILKKLLIGSDWGREHSTPFWSLRHFTYFFVQDVFFNWCRRPLRALAGTILANPILRGMGCRIGKRTIVSDPLQAYDWNAVSFGDDCLIEGMLQLHTFEDMMLKVKRAEIRDRSSVSFGTTIMSGAILEQDTTVFPLSLVLKGVHLTPGIYEGSPAQPAGHR